MFRCNKDNGHLKLAKIPQRLPLRAVRYPPLILYLQVTAQVMEHAKCLETLRCWLVKVVNHCAPVTLICKRMPVAMNMDSSKNQRVSHLGAPVEMDRLTPEHNVVVVEETKIVLHVTVTITLLLPTLRDFPSVRQINAHVPMDKRLLGPSVIYTAGWIVSLVTQAIIVWKQM